MNVHLYEKLAMSVPGRATSPWLSPGKKPLLPSEPRVVNESVQSVLTAQYLLPCLPNLHAFFLEIRTRLDPALAANQPVKNGKAYPLGQCLEITKAAGGLIARSGELTLPQQAVEGREAVLAFIAAGGSFRMVWGDLRDAYFQNAFLLGTLYVDVSNDSVDIRKPKIEILPFHDAGFRPIADFRHFARIATSYWGDQILPNHLFPAVAPYCPLLRITPDWKLQLADPSVYMISMTLADGFMPSERFLAQAPVPDDFFNALTRALDKDLAYSGSPQNGRQRALQACRSYRSKRWHNNRKQCMQFIQNVKVLNAKLQSIDDSKIRIAAQAAMD